MSVKNGTKNAYFAKFLNLRHNSVNLKLQCIPLFIYCTVVSVGISTVLAISAVLLAKHCASYKHGVKYLEPSSKHSVISTALVAQYF